MKPVSEIRPRLQNLLPEAFYVLPPEETPRGHEDALPLWAPDELDVGSNDRLATVETAGTAPQLQPSLEDLFEFGAEIDRERLRQVLGGTAGESIRKSVELRGVDALAWYVTFHAIGAQWGIYVPTTSLAYLAAKVFESLRTDFRTALKISFRALHQHELFHFATDYMCGQVEAITAKPCHKPGRSLRDQRLGYNLLEEELANGHMIRAFRGGPSAIKLPGRTAALRSFVAQQGPGYQDGARRSGDAQFEAGWEQLVWAYLDNIDYDTRGFECINLRGIYPVWPAVDWRHCPVHIIHDESRLSLPVVDIVRFAKVEAIQETATFAKQLKRLPRQFATLWADAKAKLAVSTSGHGLDFKLWDRANGDGLYSVRLSRSHRAHLRYARNERCWYAEEVGSHSNMGHG